MLSREEIEQMIDQKIEPLTEEIAALKAQLSKVDLLTIDNRNIRQSLRRIETAQESLKLDFERQEKRLTRFETQANNQFAALKADTTTIKEQLAAANLPEMKEQLALVVAMLRRVLPPEEQR